GKIGRQVLRSPQSIPRYEREAFHAGLFNGRNVGRRGRALEAGEAERLDLAALCQRKRGEHRVGEQLNLPAHEIGERRRSAFVGDDERVEPRVALEQLDSEMAGGADGGGAEGVFLRVFAHEREEIFQIVRGHARRRADDQWSLRQERHRREVAHDVVGNALVEEWIDHVHRGRYQQGVAVGRGLGDGVGADYARRAAGAILDDEVLAHRLVELLHQDARDAIDRSAGRKRHHHSDGAGGIILRRRGGRKRYHERDRKRGRSRKSHGTILLWVGSVCPGIAASVDQQILAGDEAGMLGAQKRAISAELVRPAVAAVWGGLAGRARPLLARLSGG